MEDLPDTPPPSDVLSAIKSQTEYYFSDGNLAADQFLRNLIQRDKEGFVPIKTIANFNRMKSLTTDMQVIISALKSSPDLELSSDETRVRRKAPVPEFNNQTSHRRTLVVQNLPDSASNDWLRNVFGKYGKVIRVRIYQPGSADIWPRWLKNSNFSHDSPLNFGLVEFATEEESSRAREGVKNAAEGCEESGLSATWVQVKKSSGQQQGNQQNRTQQGEKRPKQRANGNNDLSVQQGGSDQGNGPSTSTPMMPVPPDMDHPPGFQAYNQPQPGPSGRNQGGSNVHQRGSNRGGNHNYGAQGGMNGPGPSSSGHGGPTTHNHRSLRDPAGVPAMAAIPAAPPGTFIAPPPGTFGVPTAGVLYPQPMMHPAAAGSAAFQPYPPPTTAPRLALVPVPAVMPLTGGSGPSGTPRQLSRPKSTPRGVNTTNANGSMQRPRSTGRAGPAASSPGQQQPGRQQEEQARGRQQQQQRGQQQSLLDQQPQQQQQQQQQQQRGQQHSQLEHQQQQQQQQRKGNNRVLVVPGTSDRQSHTGPHPQPHPHLSQPHLQGNRVHASPSRPHNHHPNHPPNHPNHPPNHPNHSNQHHNTPNHPNPAGQQRRRSATAANGNNAASAEVAALAGGDNARDERAAGSAGTEEAGGVHGTAGNQGASGSNQGASGSQAASGNHVTTPEPGQKHKKQKHKKGKGKGAGAASEGEDAEEGTPASGGKGSHQKRGNQHKHEKQHHGGGGDAQADGAEDEDGKEWRKHRGRKDYAAWAAATQDFRAQAIAAKSSTAKGAAAAAAAAASPEPLHKDGSQRMPRMPDGTKGFTMGRGKPLPKPGAPVIAGSFVPSGADVEQAVTGAVGTAAESGAVENGTSQSGTSEVGASQTSSSLSLAGADGPGTETPNSAAGQSNPGPVGHGTGAMATGADHSAAGPVHVGLDTENAVTRASQASPVPVGSAGPVPQGGTGEESAAPVKSLQESGSVKPDADFVQALTSEVAAVQHSKSEILDSEAAQVLTAEVGAVQEGRSDVEGERSSKQDAESVQGLELDAVVKGAESELVVAASEGLNAAGSAGVEQQAADAGAETAVLPSAVVGLEAKFEIEADGEAVSEVKAEAVSEAKAETVIEARAEAGTEAKAEPVTEAKAEPASEAKAESVIEAKTESVTEAKAKAGTEAKAESELEAKAESEPEAKLELGADLVIKCEAESAAKFEAAPAAVKTDPADVQANSNDAKSGFVAVEAIKAELVGEGATVLSDSVKPAEKAAEAIASEKRDVVVQAPGEAAAAPAVSA